MPLCLLVADLIAYKVQKNINNFNKIYTFLSKKMMERESRVADKMATSAKLNQNCRAKVSILHFLQLSNTPYHRLGNVAQRNYLFVLMWLFE
jgi:hypothetical protein